MNNEIKKEQSEAELRSIFYSDLTKKENKENNLDVLDLFAISCVVGKFIL